MCKVLIDEMLAKEPEGAKVTVRAFSVVTVDFARRVGASGLLRGVRNLSDLQYEVQQAMVGWFADEGLVSDAAPIVAAQENAGDPHYQPTATSSRAINRNEVVLLDLWGKQARDRAVYADISWMGFTGLSIPAPVEAAFNAARRLRRHQLDGLHRTCHSGAGRGGLHAPSRRP